MKWIDDILNGLIELVGGNNIYDVLDYLKIYHYPVNPDNPVLKGNKAIYNRIGEFECIYYSDDLYNPDFVLAHEVGHAVLHVNEMEMFYNPLLNKGRLEKEADYFATMLLYKDRDFEDWIETIDDISRCFGIPTECVKFLIEK